MTGPFVNENYDVRVITDPGALDALSLPFQASWGGISHNAVLIDFNGTVTASGGAAAGFGTLDIIDWVSFYVAPRQEVGKEQPMKGTEFAFINNIRFFNLYEYARDFGFAPLLTSAGSGGGAAVTNFIVPIGYVSSDEQVRIEGQTVAAHATYHSTATAFSMVMTIYPLTYYGSDPSLKGLIGMAEDRLDVVASGATPQRQLKPFQQSYRGSWMLGCAFITRCESARGTLADGWDTVDLRIAGKYPTSVNTPERVHQTIWEFKRRLARTVGITPLWIKPTPVTVADALELDNEATATVAGTAALYIYLIR